MWPLQGHSDSERSEESKVHNRKTGQPGPLSHQWRVADSQIRTPFSRSWESACPVLNPAVGARVNTYSCQPPPGERYREGSSQFNSPRLNSYPSHLHLNHKNRCPTLLMSEQAINRRAPDTQSAMRHFEKKGGRFLGSQKNTQTVSFGEHARVPPDAHHAQSHETHWTSRQKGRSEGFSNRLIFSNRLTRLRPSHIRRIRRIIPLPSSPRRRPTPVSPPTGERCGECDSPKIHFLPSYRFLLLCVLCGESPSPVVGEG